MANRTVKTFCRTCSGHCGMEIELEGQKITAVRGDKTHPLTRGYFCIKGLGSAQFHNGEGPDARLRSAMKRLADGRHQDIDAEQAMDEIAQRLQSIIDEHGPQSVAFWGGTQSYMGSGILLNTGLLKSLMAEMGTPYLFTGMTLDQSAKWITMMRLGAFATGKRHLQQLDAVMLVGTNPVVSHQGFPFNSASSWNPAKALRDAQREGMKLIVVDPRLTETARLADLHLPIIPGQDAALMAGLIHIILTRGWLDQTFCDRFVAHVDELRAAVAPFDLLAVAKRTGLKPHLIERAAEIIGTSPRISVGSGTGSNMATDCNLAEHLTEALNAIRGGYVRAGEALATPGIVNLNMAREMVIPPMRASLEGGPRLTSLNAAGMMGEFPSALLPQAIVEGQIKALIVLGGNPAMAIGQPNKTQPALKSLELLVAVDPRMNETAAMSHYVIAPALAFEKHDIPVLIEAWAPRPYLQYSPPILERPPGTIEDWEFLWGIGKRLGLQLKLKRLPYGVPYSAVNGGLTLDMQRKPDVEALFDWALESSPIRYAELKQHDGPVALELPSVTVAPADSKSAARLDLMPDDVREELMRFHGKQGSVGGFHYLLCCRRLLESMNSTLRFSEQATRRHGSNRVFMHPDDMAAEGLVHGDTVVVQSAHGTVTCVVIQDRSQRLRVVSMAHHWTTGGALDSHSGNLVSIEPEDLSSISYMTRQSAIPVDIRRATARAADSPPTLDVAPS